MNKAKVIDPSGKVLDLSNFHSDNSFVHLAMVDENYLSVAMHVDEGIQKKIIKGDYVDFAKLILRDKVWEDADAMQLIVKNGQTFW